MNIAIVYHDADFDGKLSNEVCRFHLSKIHPEAVLDSYGWDYGRAVPTPMSRFPNPVPDNFSEGTEYPIRWGDYDSIYIVDLSVDELMARPELRDKIVWIDHHKSAIEKWDGKPPVGGMGGSVHDWERGLDPWHRDAFPQGLKRAGSSGTRKSGWFAVDAHGNEIGFKPDFAGHRVDGVAACRLCWQWFLYGQNFGDPRPTKQDFVDRRVSEPELIRLAGEYDIWDHRDPDGKALQFGLRGLHEEKLKVLVHGQFEGCADAGTLLRSTIENGHSIKSYCDRNNAEYAAAYSQTIQWEGMAFCALNIGQRGNSDLLAGGIKPEHDALFAWRWTGNAVLVSLYHAPGKEHLDLSKIAVRYGGGGHRGACGFRLNFTQLNTILTK